MEFLISAAEKGGIVMMAHIAMLRALNHADPDPAPTPRRKRAKTTGSLDNRRAWAGFACPVPRSPLHCCNRYREERATWRVGQ